MTPAEQLARMDAPTGEDRTLAERLQVYSRLLALVADELAALEGGDAAKRRELSDARAELMRELFPPPDDEAPEDAPPAPEPVAALTALLSEALDALRQTEEDEKRSRDRWISLEGDALKALQGARMSGPRAGRYLELASSDALLDVRF